MQGTGVQLIGWPAELCVRLAENGFRVIRFDNRDVGLSSKLDSLGSPDWPSIIPHIGSCDEVKLPYKLDDFAKDAAGLLDYLKIKQTHVVGASMGGAIAQIMAIKYPDRVLSLTSIMASSGNPSLPPGNPEVLSAMATPAPLSNDVEKISSYLVRLNKLMGSPDFPTEDAVLQARAREAISRSWYPEGLARQAAAVIIGDHCDRREELKKIEIPVVVIHGEKDPVVNVAAGVEVASVIPGADLVLIPGMGHDLPDQLISEVYRGILRAVRHEIR
nr:alpha/beta hydrolase [Algoriphagus terrigena]